MLGRQLLSLHHQLSGERYQVDPARVELEGFAHGESGDVQELFAYPGSSSADADEDEVYQLEGDLLDLEPVVRDSVVLALPLQPVCDEDCQGLCAQCGADLNSAVCDCQSKEIDSRWEALKDLRF